MKTEASIIQIDFADEMKMDDETIYEDTIPEFVEADMANSTSRTCISSPMPPAVPTLMIVSTPKKL